MILQALNGYYDRLKEDTESDIPLHGFSRQKINFALLLNRDGKLLQILDLRVTKDKKLLAKQIIVPEPFKRTVGIAPNFLWDNTGYVLGADAKENSDRAIKMFSEFKKFHHSMGDGFNDEGMVAILSFLDSWKPNDAGSLERWDELAGSNVVFQLDGELGYIHEHPLLQALWLKRLDTTASDVVATCLVSGERASVARLHPDIKGVKGAQAKGASIVSFNLDAFLSYGKTQNYNAPVGESSAFAYTTVLNHLLRSESRQKVFIGDTTTVFWAERASPVEGFLGFVFDPRDDGGDHQEVRLFLEAARDGKRPPSIDPDIIFYVLGLSPNASRLSVRFWNVSTVGDVAERIGLHFADLSIVKTFDTDPDYPGMWQLLRETALQRDSKNIAPLLAGAVMRSILTGEAYPQSLLSAIINRIRSDQTINYLRASIIKACLTRKNRINNTQTEVTMTLDNQSTNTAYRLGRMFAALEKAQKDAVPGANTTIRDRYAGSASATPRTVFPQLLRLAQHHIQKSDYGRKTDKLVEEIMEGISEFPAHLSLEDQGMFWIGYYHQRQAFYTKVTAE